MTEHTMPIKEINTNRQGFTIKARIIEKSPLQSLKSGVKLFYIDLVDKHSDIIRLKFWRNFAEKWYGDLQKGKVYLIKSHGSDVIVSNARFNDTPNPYELRVSELTKVIPVEDDENILKAPKFNFVSLRDVKTMIVPSVVDLLVIVRSFTPASTILSKKTQENLLRRTVTVADESEYLMDITLWGDQADIDENLLSGEPVVAIRGVQVREYNGRVASSLSGKTVFDFKYKNEKSLILKDWYYKNSSTINFKSISTPDSNVTLTGNRSTKDAKLIDIKDALESEQFSTMNYSVIARLSSLRFGSPRLGGERKPLFYSSCPKCKKKVQNDVDGLSHCERCDEQVKVEYKYMFSAIFEDFSSSIILRCFNDVGQLLVGNISASDCKELCEHSESKFDFLVGYESLWKPYKLRIGLRPEEYNNVRKMQCVIYVCEPLCLEEHSLKLLDDIKKMIDPTSLKQKLKYEKSGIVEDMAPFAKRQHVDVT